MPRGGARVGAGRKPKARANVIVGPGWAPPTAPPAKAPPSGSALDAPPAGMPTPQRRYWQAWAPLAVTQRTLTTETIPGLREACEVAALKDAVEKRIRRVGASSDAGVSLIKTYLKMSQRLDTMLARFRLTAMGKPEAASSPRAATSNPWAATASGGR